MAAAETILFAARSEGSAEALLRRLEACFSLREHPVKRLKKVYLDTFDRSLTRAGAVLLKRRGRLSLQVGNDGCTLNARASRDKHFFSWDLEEGALRGRLAELAGIRALSPLCLEEGEERRYDLCNSDRKTVVRLYLDDVTVAGASEAQELAPLARLEGVRGYGKQLERAAAEASELKMEKLVGPLARFEYLLAGAGITAAPYSPKYSLELPRDISLRQAVSSICLYLVEAMEINLSGVLDDIDSEFLHDFRIAVRRTRSLLSQLKKHLPAEEIAFYQDEFKWLGSITGPVRDLDVYLLKRQEYRDMLPPQLHRGLDEFFGKLAGERKAALAAMRKGMRSERYGALLTGWKAFLLGEGSGGPWPAADDACLPLAKTMLRKRYRKILGRGSKIDGASPDAELHSLRIQGKKLRYLLEFFRSFCAEKEIAYFHGQLKKLQNNLGEFNDLSVQVEMLENHLASLAGRGKRSLRMAAAIGALITRLAERQQTVRRKFQKTFAEFASESNRKRFEETLA